MYLPDHFRLDDPQQQLELMRHHPFATVVAPLDGELEIAHLPLLVDRVDDRFVIHGHVAARNPLHRCSLATAIFHGPHAYISARWYGLPDMVPTWHYLTVHASGSLQPVPDPPTQRALFERMGTMFDHERSQEWWSRLRPGTYEAFRHAIVWFRMEVQTVVAKAKLGQDDAVEGRTRVIETLREQGGVDAVAIADAMAATLPPASRARAT